MKRNKIHPLLNAKMSKSIVSKQSWIRAESDVTVNSSALVLPSTLQSALSSWAIAPLLKTLKMYFILCSMNETGSIQVQKWTRSPPPSLKSIRSEIWSHCIIKPWPLKGSPPGLYSVIIILLCKGLCPRNVFSGGCWGLPVFLGRPFIY